MALYKGMFHGYYFAFHLIADLYEALYNIDIKLAGEKYTSPLQKGTLFVNRIKMPPSACCLIVHKM